MIIRFKINDYYIDISIDEETVLYFYSHQNHSWHEPAYIISFIDGGVII